MEDGVQGSEAKVSWARSWSGAGAYGTVSPPPGGRPWGISFYQKSANFTSQAGAATCMMWREGNCQWLQNSFSVTLLIV